MNFRKKKKIDITIGESKMLWSSSVLELVEHKLCPLVESPDSGTGPTSGKLLRTTKTSPDLRVLSSVSFFMTWLQVLRVKSVTVSQRHIIHIVISLHI